MDSNTIGYSRKVWEWSWYDLFSFLQESSLCFRKNRKYATEAETVDPFAIELM